MRIAVASDLHAYDVTMSSPPSSLCMADPADQPTKHPLTGLKRLITTEGLKADLLVCPGDLADKANTAALAYVWSELHQLKSLLGADRLIATAGNHDVDSRHQHNDFDAQAALQALSPRFPGLSEPECDRYWARKFVLIDEPTWRIVVLNSSAYHGGGKDQLKEAQHGRISIKTVADIESALNSSSARELNILLCHHHLYRDNAVNEKDYSEMDGADHLLRLLGSGNYGQWVVMHGHKHHPKLNYGHGGMVVQGGEKTIQWSACVCAGAGGVKVGHWIG